MKVLKKASAALMSAALLISLLASCSTGSKVDPIQEALGYSQDTVFATFNGDKITAGEYLPWLANYVTYMDGMYKMMGNPGINWDEDMGNGTNAKEYMKSQVMDTVKLFWAMESLAKEEGAKVSAEDKKKYEEQRAEAVKSMGSEEAYAVYLKSMCLTEKQMERISTIEALSKNLQAKLCGEGKKFTANADTLHAYLDELGVLKAKHILLLTKDPSVDGPAYSKEKIAEQKVKADSLLAQLRSAQDPVALFDTLMKENSEDTGLEGNPNGYLFSTKPDGVDFSSRMVPEFEKGTAALGYNQISDVIQSDYGYHIILRLDPLEDKETYAKYEEKWYGEQLNKLYQERVDKVEVKTTDAYNNLDVKDFYDKLTAYTKTQMDALPKEDQAQTGDGSATGNTDSGAAGGDGNKTDGTEAPKTEEGATPNEGQAQGTTTDGTGGETQTPAP